jgi:regulator of PEP synthase PpsR (kinase-PPPase family)
MKDQNLKEYTDLESIKKEVEDSKNLFKKNNWPLLMLQEDLLKKPLLNIKNYRD